MSVIDIRDKIQELSNDDLILICKEIYDWHYIRGYIEDDSILHRFAKSVDKTPRDLEASLIEEANNRFSKIVTLLMCERPTSYMKIAH